MYRRAVAIAFVAATGACADNLIEPTSTLAPTSLSLSKKSTLPVEVRGLRNKDGLTLFEVSTGDPDNPTVAPGQLTHVHFKLCKGWEKDFYTTKQFSANFHYATKSYYDKEKDDEVDSPLDPDDHAAKYSEKYGERVNWDRSATRTTIRKGGYSTFKFTGLPEGIPVEVKVTYKVLKDNSKYNQDDDLDNDKYETRHIYLCVPVSRAPNPTLTAGGFLGLSGPDFAIYNRPVTYNIFVADPVGTANVSAVCNLWIKAPGSSVPALVATGPVQSTDLGGGVCSFDYTFPTGGAYVVTATLTGVLPIDYDVTDNTAAINVNVSGPSSGGGGTGGTGGNGGGNGGGDPGPESVVASFSALGTVETVNIPNGATTITSYSDINVKSTADPGYFVGDEQPSQGVNIKVTLLKELTGPFTVNANLSTDGSRLGTFSVGGLTLDPTVRRKAAGNVALAPGDVCTRIVTVDEPEGYQVQVCVNHISGQTVYFFNAHANFDGNVGHFVPYGRHLSFESDLQAEGKHYRIPTQTFGLESATGVYPSCTRTPTMTVGVSCTYSSNTTTRAGSDAQRSNIIIFGSID